MVRRWHIGLQRGHSARGTLESRLSPSWRNGRVTVADASGERIPTYPRSGSDGGRRRIPTYLLCRLAIHTYPPSERNPAERVCASRSSQATLGLINVWPTFKRRHSEKPASPLARSATFDRLLLPRNVAVHSCSRARTRTEDTVTLNLASRKARTWTCSSLCTSTIRTGIRRASPCASRRAASKRV